MHAISPPLLHFFVNAPGISWNFQGDALPSWSVGGNYAQTRQGICEDLFRWCVILKDLLLASEMCSTARLYIHEVGKGKQR